MPRQPTDETAGYSNSVDMDGIINHGESGNGRARIAKQEDSGAFNADRGYMSDMREGNHSYFSNDIADMGLGYRSVDFEKLTRHMINISYWENKARYMGKSAEQRAEENAIARYKRSQRGWCDVRMDSINRVAVKHYKRFLLEREPDWIYGSDAEKDALDGLDTRTSQQLGLRWRVDEDIRKFNAFIARYCAWLEGRSDTKVINQRFRRNEAHKRLGESVFVCDALATGITFSWDFDADELLRYVGDELWLRMNTERSDRERRAWLIHEAEHSFYGKGALFPTFVNVGLMADLEEVVRIIRQG